MVSDRIVLLDKEDDTCTVSYENTRPATAYFPARSKESKKQSAMELYKAIFNTLSGRSAGELGAHLYFADKWDKLVKSKNYAPHYEKEIELIRHTVRDSEFVKNLPSSGTILVDIGTNVHSFKKKTNLVARAIYESEHCELKSISLLSNNFNDVVETAQYVSANIYPYSIDIGVSEIDITKPRALEVYREQCRNTNGNVAVVLITGGTLLNMPEFITEPKRTAEDEMLSVIANIQQGFGTGTHIVIPFDGRNDKSDIMYTYKETKEYNEFILSFFDYAKDIGIISKDYDTKNNWKVETAWDNSISGKHKLTVYAVAKREHTLSIVNPDTGNAIEIDITKGDRMPVIHSRKWNFDTLSSFFTKKAGLQLVGIYPEEDSDYFVMHLKCPKPSNSIL